jgi:Tol biopolymer transport system component
MLTGEQLFQGETISDTLAAVLKTDPDWSVRPNGTPLEIRRLLRRCLARDPQRRLHDIADARIEIEDALEQPQMPAEPAPKKHLRLAWIAAASLLLGTLGGWLVPYNRNLAYHESAVRLHLQLPEGGRFVAAGAFAGGLAVSPDGTSVAFVAVVDGTAALWVRSLDGSQARLLPGTAGATYPFWSPDSKTLAFFSFGRLQALDILRGTSSKICDVNGVFVGGAWSNDGRILLAIRDAGIFQVPASGGSPSQFTTVDHAHGEISHVAPQILPDGKFLYSAPIDREAHAVYAAPLQNPSRRVRLLAAPLSGFTYARANHGEDYLLWIQGTTLVAQQLDVDKLQLTGDTVSLADPVAAVSAGSGVLVYAGSVALRQFRWFDRAGKDTGALGEAHDYIFCGISPDGRRVATVYAGGSTDIWLLETARGVASRMTSRGIHIMPVWSPDGRTILFGGVQPFNLFRIPADGSGAEERIIESKNGQAPMDWSRDGRLVLYNDQTPDTGRDTGPWK